MADKTIPFVAEKSRELLDQQVQAYRSVFTKAGTLLGVQGLFLPLFIFVLEEADVYILLIAIVPIGILVWAMIVLIQVLKPSQLLRGFSPEQYDEVIAMSEKKAQLYEIGANRAAFYSNVEVLGNQNKSYNKGITLTIVAITLSAILMVGNAFNNQSSGVKAMSDQDKQTDSTNSRGKDKIPTVPKDQLVPIQEGVRKESPKPTTETPKPDSDKPAKKD